MCVRNCRRTRVLKERRIARSMTRLWAVVVVPAAQLIRAEGGATTFATHDMPIRSIVLQPMWAGGEQINPAPDHRALAFPFVGGDRHGNVEPVDQTDSIRGEVSMAVVESELC